MPEAIASGIFFDIQPSYKLHLFHYFNLRKAFLTKNGSIWKQLNYFCIIDKN